MLQRLLSYAIEEFKKVNKIMGVEFSDRLKRVVDETNNREVKPREDLYLLKDNDIPSVLIECGFLSNNEEAEKLKTEDYQKQVAFSIATGILNYYEGQ